MILDTILNLLIVIAAIVLVWRIDRLLSSTSNTSRAREILAEMRKLAALAAKPTPKVSADSGSGSLDGHEDERKRE